MVLCSVLAHCPSTFVVLIVVITYSRLYSRFVSLLAPEAFVNSLDGSAARLDSPEYWNGLGRPRFQPSDDELDPGSWRRALESGSSLAGPGFDGDEPYNSGVSKMVSAVSSGEVGLAEEAVADIDAAAEVGHPHAQSALGFLYGMGLVKERNESMAFVYHRLAAQGGNPQSKMAVAYSYFKRGMYEEAFKLYWELAEVVANSFVSPEHWRKVASVRLHINGTEEDKEALRKSQVGLDEDFQTLESQAQEGNAAAMYKVGRLYYFGQRGSQPDPAKALWWVQKAVEEKGEPRSMELLGQMYARGDGVEKNYSKALELLTLASERQVYSAYNGMGYLYVKGYGVGINYSKAMEYFEKAAANEESGGRYNLGLMYFEGEWVKRDMKLAFENFFAAGLAGHQLALHHVLRIVRTIAAPSNDLVMAATGVSKELAQLGPWSSLSTWALESYLKGDVGKAFFLYSRMAELGCDVSQSNAAWILDKYGERSMCIGESGFCTDAERNRLAHSLWQQTSKQEEDAFALLNRAADHARRVYAFNRVKHFIALVERVCVISFILHSSGVLLRDLSAM